MPTPDVLGLHNEFDCIDAANRAVWGLRDFRKTDSGLVVPIREFLVELQKLRAEGLGGVGLSIGRYGDERKAQDELYVGFLWKSENSLLGKIKNAWDPFVNSLVHVPQPRLSSRWDSIDDWSMMTESWDHLDEPLQVLVCAEFKI